MSFSLLWNTWWRKPHLRGDGEAPRKATWTELFFDLVFVVIVREISHSLGADVSWAAFGGFLLFLIPTVFMWLSSTMYNNRFDNDDASHRVFTFLKMVPAAMIAVAAHRGLVDGAAAFAVAYALFRFLIAFMWLRAGVSNAPARGMGVRLALGSTLSACLWLASLFVAPPLMFVLWGVGLVVDVVTPFTTFSLQATLPRVNSSHMLERYGLFMIIVLGEVVIITIYGLAKLPEQSLVAWTVTILGMLLAFAFWWSYFDNSTNESPSLRGNWSVIRAYMHLPMIIGMATVGACLLELLNHLNDPFVGAHRWMMVLGVALTLGSMGVIEWAASQAADDARVRRRIAWLRFVSTGLVLLVGLLVPATPLWVLGSVCAISAAQPLFSALFNERELLRLRRAEAE